MTSVAKDQPIASGGGEVDWLGLLHRRASIRNTRDYLVQIEGEQIAFDNHLQLVTGRVTELNVESSRKAIQSHGTIMQSLDGDKGS